MICTQTYQKFFHQTFIVLSSYIYAQIISNSNIKRMMKFASRLTKLYKKNNQNHQKLPFFE